jgi:hypothetical protein
MKPLTAYLVEVATENYPEIRPFDTNSIHVVVRDIHKFLETEEPRVIGKPGRLDLLP